MLAVTSPSTKHSCRSLPCLAHRSSRSTPAEPCPSGELAVCSEADNRSKDSHLLLTTLILGNMIVNEALPVITDGVLGGGIYAVIISTVLVVM